MSSSLIRFGFFIILFLVNVSKTFSQQAPSELNLRFRKIITMKDGVKGYLLKLKTPEDSLDIQFLKTSRVTQLCKTKDGRLWLGQDAVVSTYLEHLRHVREEKVTKSNIVIKFSKPVTSINFLFSHFNFDNSGMEEIQEISLLDETSYDVTSSARFDWITGPNSGIDSSIQGATVIKKNLDISAKWGYNGGAASGQLVIESDVPFSQITLKHRVIWGTPNGIYIDAKIDYTLPNSKKELIAKANKASASQTTIAIASSNETLKDSSRNESLSINTTITIDSIKIKDSIEVSPVVLVDNKEKKDSSIVPKPAIVKSTPTPKVVAKPKPKPPVQNNASIKKPAVAPKKPLPVKKEVPMHIVTKKPSTNSVAVKKEVKPSLVKKTASPVKVTPKQPAKVIESKKTYNLSQLGKLEVGEKIKLERVFFKQSVAELLPESYSQLDTLILLLKQYPKLEIEIQGHTDNQGPHQPNLVLSEKRAIAVRDYLITKGILEFRLTYKGFGGTKPYLGNETEEHRRLNRRVEFMIIKK